MPMDMMTFMSQLNDTLVSENGPNLAYLLRPTSPHGKDLVKEFKNPVRPMFRPFEGAMQSPWDEIAIQYALTCGHIAKRRHGEAFKEHSQLVSLFLRFFTENRGWTLPALFSILRDLRDLAFDADHHAKYNGQKSECMEDAARTIAKAFGNCMTDRYLCPHQCFCQVLSSCLHKDVTTRPVSKMGNLLCGWPCPQVLLPGKFLFCVTLVCIRRIALQVKRISLSKNILRALDANTDIPALSLYPRSHQVTYRYYLGMLSFLNEDYAKVIAPSCRLEHDFDTLISPV
ncbi:hypothetical protein H2248_006748 [Termitomyces sp. 'cryptogamus']|nr:hypothetical protein H2248_006748 [Termitomyces sp. 'cryptogamus']